MNESNLKKEFSKRDVQRMRNIIKGNSNDATGVQLGYSKQSQDYQEGDIWEENGKKWTIKNGLKQTLTKYDSLKKLIVFPLTCPNCEKTMNATTLNKKMYKIHGKCFDCVIDMEAQIRREGRWEEYERQMMNSNKNAMVNDFEESVEDFYKTKNESYVTEQGDVESWSGGKINEEEIKNVKEYIKNLRNHQL